MHRDGTQLEFEIRHSNLIDDEHIRGIVLNSRDISERKAFERQLAHQAFHDSVTGLANRALFADRVAHALSRRSDERTPMGVMFIDLDDFKTINDSLGHPVGDTVLREVGERLLAALRPTDTAARFGGDEFAVLLEEIEGTQHAADIAERLKEAIERPVTIEDKQLFVRASIGICLTRAGEATSPEDLLRNADVAMYMAKRDIKGSYRMFEPAMHESVVERLELRADLQRAIDEHQLEVHYQPVVRLDRRVVYGLEALLRWQHPAKGTISPLQFIPLAEETGLIIPIGRWVLHEACKQGAALQRAFGGEQRLTMSVNLSVKQLQSDTIVADVESALAESGLAPDDLVLEITESVMMLDTDLAVERLKALKNLGVRVALDDFGTGYSSLSYLSRFPIDILKMDRSFLQAGRADSGLAAAIVSLGETLDLQVVAEGIEMPEQLSHRCSVSAASSDRASSSRRRCRFPRWWSTSDRRPRTSRRPTRPTAPSAMQHSYEALDRPGGFSRVNLLHPLRHRRFLLLWSGMTVSLFGDGIFLVAMAWQVYELWNAPAALSVIGIAMTVPTIACLLPGGVVSDRLDRRTVMLAADALRAVVIGLLAVLSATGALTLWELAVLCAVYGVGTAFFNPAFDAVVPDILPADQLAAANSLDQFVRPLALRLAGPAAAGWLIASLGLGLAFAVDALSFCVSAAALVAIGRTPRPRQGPSPSAVEDVRQGFEFIRRRVWLWGTLLSAAVAYLVFLGPDRGAPAVHGEERRPRVRRVARARLRSRRPRCDRLRARHGPAGAAAPWGALHLRHLDARDRRGRRLRARDGDVAADARMPRLQRARDGRDDRVGDAEADPRAGGAAGPGLEPRLAHLDRAPAAVVRADRAGGGAARGRGRRSSQRA